MASRVIMRDNGAKALRKRLDAVKNRTITVGIHDEEGAQGEGGGLTVADVAAINEFGGGSGDNPPARPFVSGWADGYEEHDSNMTKLGQAIVKGMDPEKGIQQVALKYEGLMKAYVQAGVAPPNAPATVARKGSSKPLINTGQLVSAIRARVEGAK